MGLCLQEMRSGFCEVSQIMNAVKSHYLIPSDLVKQMPFFFFFQVLY